MLKFSSTFILILSCATIRAARPRLAETGVNKNLCGDNLISFSPVQMTNIGRIGIGFQYERFLNKGQTISAALPFALTFYEDPTRLPSEDHGKQRTYAQFYPGIKVYPWGSRSKLFYNLGGSMALGFGKEGYLINPDYGPTWAPYIKETSVFRAGCMINNGLTYQPKNSFFIGLELGVGFLFSNNSWNVADHEDALTQAQIKIGWRI